ncbi:MAG: acyl-CoA dehydrogenase family protein, partial [Candidatus Cloacimonetes bacterium]|nr:acyl-CoA dehydrogenase family protein [Candidatus Cloacimonadota bacterium]
MILNDKHLQFKKKVKEFADNVVAPRAIELDLKSEFPYDLVKKMGEMGLYGLFIP